jgi:multidrug efflux pump
MARFFIDRPIFAWVIAILIMLMGGIALKKLPVAQYPVIAPPTISVIANYTGASAQTVADSVTAVIEQQLNGIEGLLYISSASESSGEVSINLYFKPGTNAEIAQVQVQNKLQLALPRLPRVVQQAGVQVLKASNTYLMFVTAVSTDGKMDEATLGNYLAVNFLDSLRRTPGIGQAELFGTEHAMRIWLNPDRLNQYQMVPSDVIRAIQEQNIQVSAGEFGGIPATEGQQLNASIVIQSRLTSAAQFEDILLRVNSDGSQVKLNDVARVELGGQDYSMNSRISGKPAAAIGIKLAPSANALATSQAVRAKCMELAKSLPPGIKIEFPYDTSAFIKISIQEVVTTLFEAIALVFLVMYLFLQNIRATLIPTIVVPVALLGTLVVMSLFGYSINVLTMFGMVLAIGLLVDDAIVVVENVERIMTEEGLPPKEATRKAMGQISNALIGITVVLTAVFIPMAFFDGSVGIIYRQFSLAMISCMLISVLLAFTLTPALCATLLKQVEPGQHHAKGGFFGWFNRAFQTNSLRYQAVVAGMLNKTLRWMLLFVLIMMAVVVLFRSMPTSFLPEEDQGYLITSLQLPVGATQQQTIKVLEEVERYFEQQPETDQIFTIAGFNFNGRGQNGAMGFINLKHWSERKDIEHRIDAIINRAMAQLSSIKQALVFPFNAPPIDDLGNATGFDFFLQDRGNHGHAELLKARNQLIAMAASHPDLKDVRAQGLEDTPQYKVDIQHSKARALGLSLDDINTTLSAVFGSIYVNDFTDERRVHQVIVQGDKDFRMLPKDIEKLYVRNSANKMVPFSAFASARWVYGSPRIERYNGFPAMEILGDAPEGKSSGEAMLAIEQIAAKLPAGFVVEWTGQSYQERLSGAQAPALFALSLIVVFLCLAALYESWSIPMAVILVVPLGLFGALLATILSGLPNDVYFKVGLITTIGLSTKNAILIIEFAKDLQAEGMGLIEATLEAVHRRLRPILMTSIAFILGVMPLVLSTGAGAASRNAIGTGVAGGMLSATVLAIFLVPVFFVVVRKLFIRKSTNQKVDTANA